MRASMDATGYALDLKFNDHASTQHVEITAGSINMGAKLLSRKVPRVHQINMPTSTHERKGLFSSTTMCGVG